MNADGVKASRRTHDASDSRLEIPHPHLVADVAGFGLVRLPQVRQTHVPPRGDSHRGIDESQNQRLQRVGGDAHAGIGVDDDLAPQMGPRRVLRGRLPPALRQPQQLDAAGRERPHDVVGTVGRGVGDHQDLAPIDGIIDPQQPLERLPDHSLLIVRREHDRDRRPEGGRGWQPRRRRESAPHPQQRRVAGVGVGDHRRAAYERPGGDAHLVATCV